MANRTIQSPGVQINEVDLSLAAVGAPPTTIFIPGFAPKGPVAEPIQVSSLSEFEQIFGQPTNAAERYFYYTVKAAFTSNSNIQVFRLAYGSALGIGTSSQYSALVYPVASYTNGLTSTSLSATALSASTIFFGQPTHITLSQNQYLAIQSGNAFSWQADTQGITTFTDVSQLGQAGLIILNNSQSTINQRFEGLYLGIIDNTNHNPAINYNDINAVFTINSTATAQYAGGTTSTGTSYISIPNARLNFPLSATPTSPAGSVSEVLENIPTFTTSTPKWNDTISLGLFKLRQSVFSPDTIALDYVLQESYVASLDYYRQQSVTTGGQPVSFFLENVDNPSSNIVSLVNPYISNRNVGTSWLDLSGNPTKTVRFLSSDKDLPVTSDTNSYTTGTCTSAISAGVFTGSPTLSSVYPNGISLNTVLNTTAISAVTAYNTSLSADFGNFQYVLGSYETRIGAPSGVVTGLINTLGTTSKLMPLGVYAQTNLSTKVIGDVPGKVTNMLNLISNSDIYPLSIVTEAGLGTIFVNSLNPATSGYFDDTVPFDSQLYALTAQQIAAQPTMVANYLAAVQPFVTFASATRKDHLFIADPITNIFVEGNNLKTLADPNKSFSQNIYWPLRNQFSTINTSYACAYANIAQVYDNVSNSQVWVPFSGFAAAAMGNTDSNFYPWYAPAGFTRGVINSVTDLGYYANQKERDQLYSISLNPVAYFPNEGFVIFGQKTAQKLPSAFDRINVRRLFLTLETQVKQTVRYYVFEPNTLFTRTNIINVLTPIFDLAKNTQGLYDYLIICDERNNTPAVIDDNSLVVDIYLKPVRSAEFILVNFYATRTNQNFTELVA